MVTDEEIGRRVFVRWKPEWKGVLLGFIEDGRAIVHLDPPCPGGATAFDPRGLYLENP